MDKDKLKEKINEELLDVADGVLNMFEIVVNKEVYVKVRSKVLRQVNNAIRNLNKYIDGMEEQDE